MSIVSNAPTLSIADRLANKKLDDCTWEEISWVSRNGLASQLFSVGDIKHTTFNGSATDPYVTTIGKIYSVQIVDFDHDTPTDTATYGRAKAGITFTFGRDGYNTTYAGFPHPKTKLTTASTPYPWNNSATNVGGWEASVMRNTTLPEIESLLDADMIKVMVKVNKQSTSGGTATDLVTTSDLLFLPAASEIANYSTTSAATGSSNGVTLSGNKDRVPGTEGTPYSFFLTATNHAMRRETKGEYMLTRSCDLGGTTNIICVNYNAPAYWAANPSDIKNYYVTSSSSTYVNTPSGIYFTPFFCV